VGIFVDILRCLRESESHPFTATFTTRKNSPGRHDDLMLLGVMFAIDLVV
jgi:hypothetical protein